MKIGFIGVGVMGAPMVQNLMKKGHELSVYNRTKEKAAGVVAAGAKWCESAGACAKDQDVVITIVGYPKDVEEVYFAPGGILDSAAPGTVLIDMTTTSPRLSERIYAAAKEKGMTALDAPVSGGDVGAQKGTLAIMVGGDREAFDRMQEVFAAMGTNIRYMGGAGCGQHTKMANQIAISGCIAAVCEAIAYAEACGLKPQEMFDAISTGAAGSWQLTNNGQKIIDGNYAPGFYVKHFIKDMNIALEEAKDRDLPLDVLKLVRDKYDELAAAGGGDEGTQALIQVLRK
ncbi:MAG TPA: NAD(P)-dependent oxidoreductase [Candidatus Spyradocola merdavium]|nr:NAD(P)-dependent oxidoreductase [Candidatus Spyradocola merdavium]